jgi:uncharacterized damage-inducible protein DinB
MNEPIPNALKITRPSQNDHSTFYERYVSLVPGDDLLPTMQAAYKHTQDLMLNLPEEKHTHRYAEGKWSIREVIGHITDAERIFGYRALRFARQDTTELAGFDENAYVPASNAHNRELNDLLIEFTIVRAATLSLFKGFTEEMLDYRGVASGSGISVRSLGYVIAGHEMHHIKIIEQQYLA